MNIRMATLPQMLRDHARRSPQRLSQRHKTRGIWREYDFSQVQRNVMDLALGLHQLGIQRGETAKGCNALADQDDIRKITRAINGGLIGLAERMEWARRTTAVWL